MPLDRFAALPEICFRDGGGYSVGDQSILGGNANLLIDRKTAKLGSFLWPNTVSAGLTGFGPPEWATLFAGPVFLGFDQTTSAVMRSLTVAPFWRSATLGVQAWLRITISRHLPSYEPSSSPLGAPSDGFGRMIHPGESEITTEWNTSSDTWQTGAAATLELACKHLQYGEVWMYIEGSGAAQCRGLSQMAEGIRVVT